MIKSSLIFIFATLFLIGCSSPPPQIITRDVHNVVMPNAALFECPMLDKFPEKEKLTNIAIANIIKTLYVNNMTCYNNINAIKQFLEESQKIVDGRE